MDYSENKYAAHLKESYNRHYFENKYGFITWQKYGDSVVINTLYILPEYRSEHHGSDLADHVSLETLGMGINNLLCEIDTRSKTYDEAFKAITGYGFKVKDWIGSYVILEKELSNG